MLTDNDLDTDQVDGEVATLLRGVRRLGVAFSGGVDSSVLLALAVRALGPGSVVAILGVSPSLAGDERRSAHDVAAFIGAEVIEVVTHEGDRPAYVANGPDRCFHCKDELFATISDQLLQEHRLDAVAYGENADDAKRPDRPGARAATNHRVLRPLADAGWDKRTVRAIASRIPHYQAVTPTKLRQIEDAETSLRALGFSDLRVRHHGEIARIELPPDELVTAVTEPMRSSIREAMQSAGFRFAVVDLAGVQSGAFTLPLVQINHG